MGKVCGNPFCYRRWICCPSALRQLEARFNRKFAALTRYRIHEAHCAVTTRRCNDAEAAFNAAKQAASTRVISMLAEDFDPSRNKKGMLECADAQFMCEALKLIEEPAFGV